MGELAELVINPFVSALVGALVASAVAFASRKWSGGIDTQRAIVSGMRTLLRNELVAMHREWAEEKGYVTLEALEYAQETYEAYHGLGGNGSGTKLWEDINALPVRD